MVAVAEDEADQGEITINDADEVDDVKMAVDPGQPTPKQLEDHRRLHLPYRLWCKWCVMGRGRGFPHTKSPANLMSVIGVDYFFITADGIKMKNELEQLTNTDGDNAIEDARARGDIIKCVVVRDSLSKCVFGHVIPQKGVDENGFVANLIAEDVHWLGHAKIVIKSDNEPAVQSLVRRVVEIVRAEVIAGNTVSQESSTKHDSQSNGGTEIGVRLLRGLFRTTKLCMESRINKYVPVSHALVPWIMEHTALLLNTVVRGEDGLTPWARARGRPFRQHLLGFGEGVLFKFPSKGPDSAPPRQHGQPVGRRRLPGVRPRRELLRHRHGRRHIYCAICHTEAAEPEMAPRGPRRRHGHAMVRAIHTASSCTISRTP